MTQQSPTILVTGATDGVGRHVVSRLLAQGATVRGGPQSWPGKLPANVELVRGDLTDPSSLDAALIGVDSVFLVWPFCSTDAASAVVDEIANHARRGV